MNHSYDIPAARQLTALGQALRQTRALGVPDWAVAREAGISPALLSMVASGTVRATDQTAKAVSRALGRPIHELFPDR